MAFAKLARRFEQRSFQGLEPIMRMAYERITGTYSCPLLCSARLLKQTNRMKTESEKNAFMSCLSS